MSLSTLLSGVATNTPVKVWLPVIGINAVAIPDQIPYPLPPMQLSEPFF